MALPSTILRVVLSLAVILNGVGSAVAATRMHVDQVSAAQAPSSKASKASGTGMPCHQHLAAQQTGNGPASSHDTPATPPGKSPAPDCCKAGMCSCACAHMAQVVVLALPGTAPVLNHSLAVKPLPLAHAAPALPHLIRPPIG